MEETILLSSELLSLSVFMFVFLAFVGLTLSLSARSYDSLKKRFSLLMPMYYMFFTFIFFMGVLLLSFKSFDLSFINILMLFAWAIMLYTGIKAYKLSKQTLLYERFKSFVWKKYLGDILLCAALHLFAKTAIF
jgi:hypothetical protein